MVESTPSRRALIIALCGGYFLVLLDVTVVNVALPSIGRDFHTSGTSLAWVVDAYAIPLAALLMAVGAIGDRVGHRRTVLVGFIGFGVASVLCATADELSVLIAGRALQGVAAAIMFPGTLALLTDVATDEGERARLVGLWAAIGGIALPAGPIVGGVLVHLLGWHAVFWLNVPIIVAVTSVVVRVGPPSAPPTSRATTGRVNWPSAVLLTGAMAASTLAVTQARTDHLHAIVAGCMAVVCFGALVVAEHPRVTRYFGVEPLLSAPRRTRTPLLASCVAAGLMNLGTVGTLFLLTQVLQDSYHHSPPATGFLMLPALAPLPFVAAPAARLTARRGAWPTAAVGFLITSIGLLVVATTIHAAADVTSMWAPIAGFLLWGTGIGIIAPAVVTAALAAVPHMPGLASGASNTSRQFGGAVGVALFATVTGPATAPGFADRAGLMIGSAAAVFGIVAITTWWLRPAHAAV